jgi:hypothetical protein
VNSLALRRLQIPLPATSYNPLCENNFQQEFRPDVSNQELIAERNPTEILADAAFTFHDRAIQPFLLLLLRPREGNYPGFNVCSFPEILAVRVVDSP